MYIYTNDYMLGGAREREREREQRGLRRSNCLFFACSLPVLCLVSVRLLFSVFCSLFSVNQSISTVVCSSQLYSEGGGASQPRSKQVSWTFANAEVIGN